MFKILDAKIGRTPYSPIIELNTTLGDVTVHVHGHWYEDHIYIDYYANKCEIGEDQVHFHLSVRRTTNEWDIKENTWDNKISYFKDFDFDAYENDEECEKAYKAKEAEELEVVKRYKPLYEEFSREIINYIQTSELSQNMFNRLVANTFARTYKTINSLEDQIKRQYEKQKYLYDLAKANESDLIDKVIEEHNEKTSNKTLEEV